MKRHFPAILVPLALTIYICYQLAQSLGWPVAIIIAVLMSFAGYYIGLGMFKHKVRQNIKRRVEQLMKERGVNRKTAEDIVAFERNGSDVQIVDED